MAHRPRRRFGQNFLHDRGIIERMLRAIAPAPEQTLVEIGPGRGALTLPLLERVRQLQVVELDRDLVATLETLPQAADGRLRVHQGDALGVDFTRFVPRGERLRVVGNLPYNISTPLVFHLLDQAEAIADMHFLLQREVVARMAATPGGREYGRLSVMVQAHCRVESLFDVPPGAFYPAPKVMSRFVRLVPHARPPVSIHHPQQFAEVVSLAFSGRRKTLRNALRGRLDAAAIAAADVDPAERAERLPLAAFARLADALAASPAESAPRRHG
jgi:16S rRNA (adenine1518-N6/adenine1519-N6)-dimethyltransferase